MALNTSLLLSRIVSHALALGVFKQVNKHEPKSAPTQGLTAAVWVDEIEPIRSGGLNSTSARVAFNFRIYLPMIQKPEDEADPRIAHALDLLMNAYSGDFQLGGNVRQVDLLGAYGQALSSRAGYISLDGKMYRVFTVTLPLIVNDVWEQVP